MKIVHMKELILDFRIEKEHYGMPISMIDKREDHQWLTLPTSHPRS